MDEQQIDAEAARVAAVAGELRALLGTLRRRLREEAPPGDFTPSQTSVLARLDREGPATVTTLARAEGMRPQSMGAVVSVLEAAGLVSGTPDPSDGRQTILSLTALARETIDASRVAREGWLFRTIRAKLTPDEQEELARGIELLKRLVDP
jgi:DNA-binding MarR family transcriptional regulator